MESCRKFIVVIILNVYNYKQMDDLSTFSVHLDEAKLYMITPSYINSPVKRSFKQHNKYYQTQLVNKKNYYE